jgi:DNA-directed RNA polymerase specialized sigma subunit
MDVEPDTWAEETRRALTRDLVVRARHAEPGERRSLQFRALHLNLPLVGEVADELDLTDREREAVEHAALDGLYEAVRRFDPWDHHDFAAFAAPYVRTQMVTHLPAAQRRTALARSLPRRIPARDTRAGIGSAQRRLVRLALLRAAQAMAGYRL